MLQIRKGTERGAVDFGWLQSNHSFSFGHYYDPNHTGFGPLIVINDDRVEAGAGFDTHGHRNMEIVSYVLSGSLEHKDSMGNGSVLRYGDVQRMSAGTGVLHSEYNPSPSEPVHFLQIWIQPNVQNIAPSYEERHFDAASKTGRLRLIVSADGRQGSVMVHQDTSVYAAILNGGDEVKAELADGRRAYVHVIRGSIVANGVRLAGGDALKVTGESLVTLSHADAAEILLFDLP
ncbi:pirin family protein [Noviherbaspirillum sp.]|uniref:pirin family protein n=1 Tax=Noviherbaspirillum sp. TaxID=1926288 RepID=UPI002D4D1F50|nr:pirin family protein [Noviherbaspirillum sp.]HZW20849.1 pirin family protein [Noviherbaspirillum sp.]